MANTILQLSLVVAVYQVCHEFGMLVKHFLSLVESHHLNAVA